MMQWLRNFRPKFFRFGKWLLSAVMVAGLVAFGAVDFAPLLFPEWKLGDRERALEWAQFAAYLAVAAVVIWKLRSIKTHGVAFLAKVNSGDRWSTSDMIWAGLATMGVIGFAPLLLPNEWTAGDSPILQRLQFAAYMVGGGFLIWQLRISNRRATAAEKTATLIEKGNITERFKSAIEHLANASDSVQIGGIYTLYHIAKEAKEYKEAVLKILIAHLRKTLAENTETPRKPSRVAVAIMDALFARTGETPLFEAVNLSFINMKEFGWSQREIHLFDYNLSTIQYAFDLNITGVFFGSADLRGANLAHAICENTNFSWAICIGTCFVYIRRFDGAKFDSADLTDANFEGSSITAQQLLKAKTLYRAKLPPNVREEIMRERPRLLDSPAPQK